MMIKKACNEYKPSVFWSFNDVLEKEELGKQMESLLKAGCSGGFMHSRVGLVTEYMSPEWMNAIEYCCQKAREEGTSLWLYDEDRFPSGYAGGAVLAADDSLRTKALCLIEKEKAEQFHILKIYKRVSEEGKEYLIALCSAKDGNPNFEGKCYVDLLNPETTKVFIEQTHEKYRASVGKYFGKELKGIFSDEFCYTQKASFPCFSVPFTNDLELDFEKSYGYDLVECMDSLFFDREGYRRIRRDFYEFLTNRFIESFTKPYNEWCEQNGLIFTGHLLHEDFLTTQPEWTGAVMPHYPHMGMPGIDKLGSDTNYLLTVKQLTSVSEQLGKRSLCEAFGCSGHQFGPGEIKRIADWLCVLGINFINPHLTLYSSRGERKRDYPPDFSWRQPWFEVAEGCFDHISRVCELMDAGKVQTEVLLIHPIQSVWAEYSPLHKPNPVFSIWSPKNENAKQNFITETEQFQKPFLDLSNQLLEQGISYHYGDEMIMEDYGSFDNGIVIGQCRYKKIIVPPVSVLRGNTIELLFRMVEQLGKDAVIFIDRLPECIPEKMRDSFTVVRDVREAVLKLDRETTRPIEIRDAYSGQISDKVFYRYCIDECGKKKVFLVNTSKERAYDVRVKLPMNETPAVLDTVTGEYFKAPGTLTEGGFQCEIHLKVGGSAMFVAEDVEQMQEAAMLQSGVSFESSCKRVDTIVWPTGEICNLNILPLNIVDFRAAGKKLIQKPVESIWYKAFYPLKNGTEFEAIYRFSVADIPKTPVIALIEMAHHLDEILVNGVHAEVSRRESNLNYFDKSFSRVELTNLHPGENTICIRGKKCNNINGIGSHVRVPMGTEHRATELESIYICGDFGVASLGDGKFEIVKPLTTVCGSVTKSLYPFYLGQLVYKLHLTENVDVIRLDARAQAAELRINGKSKAISYVAPFEFDVSEEEPGEVEIVLYNSLENTFGPLHLAERDRFSMIGPVYFQDMKRYVSDPVLFDYGLWSVTTLKREIC